MSGAETPKSNKGIVLQKVPDRNIFRRLPERRVSGNMDLDALGVLVVT